MRQENIHEAFLFNNETEKQIKIKEYIEKNAPEHERIKIPMDPDCKVSLVIPAYGEREYIFRPLYSISQQQGVTPNEFEVIIVVNNPGLPPQKAANATDTDYARQLNHYKQALKENQITLDLIETINSNKPININIKLSDEEKSQLEAIKKSGLKLFAIDKASPGKNFPEAEANVGGARNRGVAEAVHRFDNIGKNGIVAQSDADTRFDSHYIKNLISAFENRPKMVGLAGALDFDRSEEISVLIDKLSFTISLEEEYNALVARKADHAGEELNKSVHFSGANMASRAFETALTGGIPSLGGGEDTEFGDRLSALGEVEKVPEVLVHPEYRFSARADVEASHGQTLYKQLDKQNDDGELEVVAPERLIFQIKSADALDELIAKNNATPTELKKLFTFQGEPLLSDQDADELSELLAGKSRLQDIRYLSSYNDIVRRFIKKFDLLSPKINFFEASDQVLNELLGDPAIEKNYKSIREKINEAGNKNMDIPEKLLGIIYALPALEKPNSPSDLLKVIADNIKTLGLTHDNLSQMEESPLLKQFLETVQTAKTFQEAKNSLNELLNKGSGNLKVLERYTDLKAMNMTLQKIRTQN